MRWILYNQENISDAFKSATEQPVLKLILTARSRAKGNWAQQFVRSMVDRYRNFGEETRLSERERAVLLNIISRATRPARSHKLAL
jgi:hypothetical protein